MTLSWPISHFHGFLLVLALYGMATFIFCLRVILDKKSFSITALRFVMVGFLVHLVFLSLHFYERGYPFFVSSFETLQFTALVLVFIFLLLCFSSRFITTGIVLIPLTLVFYIMSLTRIVAYETPGHVLANPLAFIHLVFIFISMAIFMVSFATGSLYLLQDYRIRHKTMGGFFDRLPPLEIMDSIHYRALYTGFVFYTIGIITGGGWSKSVLGVYLSFDIKQILSLVLWIFFAVFLNLRLSHGWVGRKGIIFSSAGFAGVIFLMLLAGK